MSETLKLLHKYKCKYVTLLRNSKKNSVSFTIFGAFTKPLLLGNIPKIDQFNFILPL